LRTYSSQRTFEKFQRCSLIWLFLPFPPQSSPPPLRPLFLFSKFPKGLARRLRWPRVRRLAREVLNSRIRVRGRRLKPYHKSRVKRLASRSRMLTPRPRMLLPKPRMLLPRPKMLTP